MNKAVLITIIVVVVLVAAIVIHQVTVNKGPELSIGVPAPDFSLPASDGSEFTLSKALGKKAVVLFFYPKNFSPGCTAEVCSFRDSFEVFKTAGAELIGVSSDSVESHKKFIKEHNLPFILLSDAKGEVRKLYGVKSSGGVIPGRVTFIVDKKGAVKYIFNSQIDAKKHVEEAKRIVEQLSKAF